MSSVELFNTCEPVSLERTRNGQAHPVLSASMRRKLNYQKGRHSIQNALKSIFGQEAFIWLLEGHSIERSWKLQVAQTGPGLYCIDTFHDRHSPLLLFGDDFLHNQLLVQNRAHKNDVRLVYPTELNLKSWII